MIAADLVRAAVFAALPFATNAGTIVALALVAGLATGFFRPAVYAGVPNLVPDELLGDANALLQTVENAAWAIGPLLGGVLTAAWGPHAAYWINAVSFLVSAVLVARIPARLLQSTIALTRGHWTDLKDGFAVVLRSRPLLAVLLRVGPRHARQRRDHASARSSSRRTRCMPATSATGSCTARSGRASWSAACGAALVVERLGIARAYGASLALMALGFGVGAASANIWMAAVCCVVGGIGDGGAVVCNALLVQRGTRDEMRGRALTFVMSADLDDAPGSASCSPAR